MAEARQMVRETNDFLARAWACGDSADAPVTRKSRRGWWALLVAGLLLYVAIAAGLLGEDARGALLWLFDWPDGGR